MKYKEQVNTLKETTWGWKESGFPVWWLNSYVRYLEQLVPQEKIADEQMELAAFEKANGPLPIHLDEVLKKMNVDRQA